MLVAGEWTKRERKEWKRKGEKADRSKETAGCNVQATDVSRGMEDRARMREESGESALNKV